MCRLWFLLIVFTVRHAILSCAQSGLDCAYKLLILYVQLVVYLSQHFVFRIAAVEEGNSSINWLRGHVFHVFFDGLFECGVYWFSFVFEWFLTTLESPVAGINRMVKSSDVVFNWVEYIDRSFAVVSYLWVFQQMPGVNVPRCMPSMESLRIFCLLEQQVSGQLHVLYRYWLDHFCEALFDRNCSTCGFCFGPVVTFWLLGLIVLVSYEYLHRFASVSSSFGLRDKMISDFSLVWKLGTIIDFRIDFYYATLDHFAANILICI